MNQWYLIGGREDLVTNATARTYGTEVQVVPLDAIVIRREELPGVTGSVTGPDHLNAGGVHFDPSWSPEDARDMALRYLAAEAYLREHPPVAAALKSDLEAAFHAGEYGATKVAAFLAERGWTKGES